MIHRDRQIMLFMDFVLVREDYHLSKPDPAPYLTGLRRFGASKEAVRVVEDSARRLQSAVAAGSDCAIVHNDFTQLAGLLTSARLRVSSLARLKGHRA